MTLPDEPEHVAFRRKLMAYAPPPGRANFDSYAKGKELFDYIDALRLALKKAHEAQTNLRMSRYEIQKQKEKAEAALAAVRAVIVAEQHGAMAVGEPAESVDIGRLQMCDEITAAIDAAKGEKP